MKHIKMMVYGEPGVGKSVFASKFPSPFFITTDGNYEWLEEFGAKIEDHQQVNSWSEFKNFVKDNNFDKYETIVVDLIEDLFKWCEFEFCQEKRIDHIGDLGYGKGYDITRNEFFIEICKLIGKEKNIVFISHEEVKVIKDRRGVEKTYYKPSARIPDKVLDMIEGRLRYVVRCYLKAEERDEKIVKRRFLSLIPKENEYGIIRGINENNLPSDIPLEASLFLNAINYNISSENKNEEIKEEVKEEKSKNKKATKIQKAIKKEDEETALTNNEESVQIEEKKEEPKEEPKEVVKEIVNEEPKKEEPKEDPKKEETSTGPMTNVDKIAMIKMKLEAIKNRK